MRSSSTTTALFWILAALGPAWGCGDDGTGSETPAPETSGDGDSGDGDGDSGDGDTGDGDGDGDSGDGDGDGDGEGAEPCSFEFEATQMKTNGQIHAAFDVDVGPTGEFVAVGRIANDSSDAWIAKFSADGEMAWEQVVDGGGGYDFASGVALDDAGDLIVVGSLQGNTNKDLWIEKRSGADGSTAWTVMEVSNFDGDNEPGDVELGADGSIFVSGSVRMGDDDTDVWVRKLSSADGAAAWTATYSGNTDMSGFSIDKGSQLAPAPDGSVYVSAEEGVDFETRDAILLEFGPDGGAAQWKLAPGSSDDPHIHSSGGVAAGPDGEAYFAMVQANGIERLWLHRVSASGEVEWTMTEDDFVYEPTRGWSITGLDIGADGNLTIGGSLRNEETGEGIDWSEVWVANISRAGQGVCIEAHTWQNEHIIPASTFNYGLAEGPGGTVVVGEIRDGPENYLWVGGFN
ncbi:hypothetical protein ENSA5_39820 [Enhygromyxa salina]|uniref:Uncharacterized protein n=1 Tax=Enhygromyxa salina TaxID=215803 RepID=A0A2S9XRA2_9BACT|nr:hypothetical protein [Enhygromyxa salina]PRP95397.1 hypothetical protein ENSA5_39820 [Enhygromyxa salina]